MSTNVGAVDFELLLNSNPFNKGLKNATNTIKTSGIENSLKKIGKLALTAFSVKAIVNFGKTCVQTATETSNAWIGLNSILTGQNKSFQQAKNFINEYISDGLVPLNNAVGAYKNLALRGYNSDQIQKTMNALKNSATFARQSTYSLGDAVQTATEGLKNENSIVVDNAGVTKNVAKMWEDYAKSIGKTTNNLTQAEKIQAEVNGILEETKFQSNDAAIYANTFSGKLAQLNTSFTNMKTAIGNFVQPIAKVFIPIITQAANAVTYLFNQLSNLLSFFGLKADSVESISSGIGNISADATKASDAVSGIGSSAKKAAKDLKSLASFDTAQVLKNNDDDNSSSKGTGTSSVNEIGDLSQSILKQTDMQINAIGNKIKEICAIFKEGFNDAFENTNFSGIISSCERIKVALIEIFKDSDINEYANEWVNTVLYNLGRLTGSVASIGITIAENLVGGIASFLEQNEESIQEHIMNMFSISTESWELIGDISETFADIFAIFRGPEAKQCTADIIAIFVDGILGISEIVEQFSNDILYIIAQPFIENKDLIKNILEEWLQSISSILGTIKQGVQDTFSKFWEVYDAYIRPAVENIKIGFSSILETVLKVWNENMKPILDEWASRFDILWKEHLQPMVNNFLEFFGKLINGISELWNKWLTPIINWIIKNVVPVLKPIIETIGNVVMDIFQTISDVLSGIWEALGGLIDFIVGVFTGDWDKAWNGIKSIFSGIWEAIKGNFEGIWQTIKDIVKGAIEFIKNCINNVLNIIKGTWENIWNGIKSFASNIWNGIKGIFSGAGSWFSNIFQQAYNGITRVFSNIGNFFSGIWQRIRDTFSSLGTSIGNAISNAVKSGINGVISLIERTINKAINLINGAIRIINLIPGVNINKIGNLNLPRLAQGGYVKANTPQLAMIGDNRHQGEVVAPEDKLMALYKKANQEMGLGNNEKVIELLERIIQILVNLSFDSHLYIDGYELNRRLEKIKNKNRFATNGG